MAQSYAQTWLAEEVLDEVAKESSMQGYISPSKLEEKKPHRFRIFGSAITGFECWCEEGKKSKPKRYPMKPEESDLPSTVKMDDSGRPQLKRFLATLVWDYQNEDFRILQITQKSIIGDLNKYVKDPDYGDPQGYDIKLTRTGSGIDTEYSVVASPPKDMPKAIQQAYEEFYCDLNALFAGEDPFKDPSAA